MKIEAIINRIDDGGYIACVRFETLPRKGEFLVINEKMYEVKTVVFTVYEGKDQGYHDVTKTVILVKENS